VAKQTIEFSSRRLIQASGLANLSVNDAILRRQREIEASSPHRLVLPGGGWNLRRYQHAVSNIKTRTGCRVFEIVHDLIPAVLPHTFGPGFTKTFVSYLFDELSNVDGVLAISQTTREDIEQFCLDLLIPTPPIRVFRLGEEVSSGESQAPAAFDLSPRSFVLTVGTIEYRKNHSLLYQVWRLARSEGIALPTLVIVGKIGWLVQDLLHVLREDPSIKDKILILSDVSDQELSWLYTNCRFSIFPSLYEGWGLPVAESLAHGRMCIASNARAITEIAGDLIDYFNPYDPRECLNLIVRYLDQTTLHKKEEAIRAGYRTWSWDQSFQQFIEALNSLGSR